jgi:hypothetical protein
MGKFHDDGTLEIGGFGGLVSDDSATKQDTDYLRAKIEHLKRLHSTLEAKTSFLTSRVKCLSKENERLSRGFSFVIVCTMILTVALIGCYVLVCNGLA